MLSEPIRLIVCGAGIVSVVVLVLFIVIWCIYRRAMVKKVSHASQNIANLLKLNHEFAAERIPQPVFRIIHPTKSYRGFTKLDFDDVVTYYIENDFDNLRQNIILAVENREIYKKYLQRVQGLNEIPDNRVLNEINMSHKKFYKYERLATKKLLLKEPYHITVKVTIFYRSPKGRNYYQKKNNFNLDHLESYYQRWCKKKSYAISAKIERSIMNDSLRYDVLKRDNFACQICGATATDGAKLHVDHIVPVSKGGKTVMSNLQTLCERCNLGKSNKL